MNISKSDVDTGVEKAEELVDESANALKRGASATAAEAKKTIRAAGEKIDKTIDTKKRTARAATAAQHRSTNLISDFIDLGARGVTESLQHRRAQVQQLSGKSMQKTADYVQQRPLQAMLIAASIGAVAVLLLSGNRRR